MQGFDAVADPALPAMNSFVAHAEFVIAALTKALGMTLEDVMPETIQFRTRSERETRLAITYLPDRELIEILNWCNKPHNAILRVTGRDIPNGVEVVGAFFDPTRRSIGLHLYHPGFPVCLPGQLPMVIGDNGCSSTLRWEPARDSKIVGFDDPGGPWDRPPRQPLEVQIALDKAKAERIMLENGFVRGANPAPAWGLPAKLVEGEDVEAKFTHPAESESPAESSTDFFQRVMGTS